MNNEHQHRAASPPYRFRSKIDRSSSAYLEWLSPGLQELVGYTPDELRFYDQWRQFVPSEYRPVTDEYDKLVRAGRPWTGLFALRAKSGTELFLEVTTDVQTLPTGTHLVHGLVRDLTEEAELRAAFQEHKARLRALNSDLGLIVWSHDARRRSTWMWGSGFSDMDPVEYESFGTSLAELLDAEGSDWSAVESAALRGETIRCEIEWKGRTYRVTVEPWRAGTEDVSGTTGVAIDQTERLGLEDQIEVLNRELMRARSNDPEPGLRGEEVMEFGELRVDPAAAKVVLRGQMVHLTPIEFKLLLVLARNAERVLSHQVLLRRVWGYEFLGSGSLIPMAINRLRMKIEEDPSNPSLITTVRGIGYCFHSEGA